MRCPRGQLLDDLRLRCRPSCGPVWSCRAAAAVRRAADTGAGDAAIVALPQRRSWLCCGCCCCCCCFYCCCCCCGCCCCCCCWAGAACCHAAAAVRAASPPVAAELPGCCCCCCLKSCGFAVRRAATLSDELRRCPASFRMARPSCCCCCRASCVAASYCRAAGLPASGVAAWCCRAAAAVGELCRRLGPPSCCCSCNASRVVARCRLAAAAVRRAESPPGATVLLPLVLLLSGGRRLVPRCCCCCRASCVAACSCRAAGRSLLPLSGSCGPVWSRRDAAAAAAAAVADAAATVVAAASAVAAVRPIQGTAAVWRWLATVPAGRCCCCPVSCGSSWCFSADAATAADAVVRTASPSVAAELPSRLELPGCRYCCCPVSCGSSWCCRAAAAAVRRAGSPGAAVLLLPLKPALLLLSGRPRELLLASDADWLWPQLAAARRSPLRACAGHLTTVSVLASSRVGSGADCALAEPARIPARLTAAVRWGETAGKNNNRQHR